MSSVAEMLEWDSAFFGRRVARALQRRTDQGWMGVLMEWCRANQVEWLYYLAAADDPVTIRTLERHEFALTDIRVDLELPTGSAAADPSVDHCDTEIRRWRPEDVPTLARIAEEAHLDSRFFHDPRVPAGLARRLFRTWIERSCLEGFAQEVLVARLGGDPVGYVTLHEQGAGGHGRIGLIGVADSARGRGIGRCLVGRAVLWFKERSLARVLVATQARNVRAQRLYQRLGFVTVDVALWYHRWFTAAGQTTS